MDSELLSVKEAATRVGITPRAIRLRIEAGRLSAQQSPGRFGLEWRVPAGEVERLREELRARKAPRAARQRDSLADLQASVDSLRSSLAALEAPLPPPPGPERVAETVVAVSPEDLPAMSEILQQLQKIRRMLEEQSQALARLERRMAEGEEGGPRGWRRWFSR